MKSLNKIDAKKHWNQIYQNQDEKTLGWYQESAKPSMKILKDIGANTNSKILIVGSGSTKFVDELLTESYENIIATDISKVALINLEDRLTSHGHLNVEGRVKFIEDDLRAPKKLTNLKSVDIWHDRAVLHFFTDEGEKNSYFKLLRSLVKKDGYVIIAVYHKEIDVTCAGLPVKSYEPQEIATLLGPDFKLINTINHKFKQPSGVTRKYVYAVFKRSKNPF